jgi:hypothetical protein
MHRFRFINRYGEEGVLLVTNRDGRQLCATFAAWSRLIGFAPHRDFAAVKRMFGDGRRRAFVAYTPYGSRHIAG